MKGAEMVDILYKIPAIELNVSCPNVKQGGMAFGVTCSGISQVVSEVRKVYHKHLMVKLSPNVTNIAEIAQLVETAIGGRAVSKIYIDNRVYDYDAGTVFMDLMNECEKTGDYINNVVEARMGAGRHAIRFTTA